MADGVVGPRINLPLSCSSRTAPWQVDVSDPDSRCAMSAPLLAGALFVASAASAAISISLPSGGSSPFTASKPVLSNLSPANQLRRVSAADVRRSLAAAVRHASRSRIAAASEDALATSYDETAG